MKDFGLYVIISTPVLSYREIAQICVQNNVPIVQLREKEKNDRELYNISRTILEITAGTETQFVINDRTDIARAVNADGVHLGQDDLNVESAVKIIGRDKIIGFSTHSIKQVQEAAEKKEIISYIGFGPLYPTNTKKNPDPVTGTKELTKALKISPLPVVAIGGISPTNIGQVIDAGAKNLCPVRYLMQTQNLELRIQECQRELEKHNGGILNG